MTSAQRAETRYQANADEAIALAEKILGFLEAEKENMTAPHWGHVGSMAAAKEQLQDVAQFLNIK